MVTTCTSSENWNTDTVGSINKGSSLVVNYLFDPREAGEQQRYGLVVGHVQSGKTANFTSVIAKAADVGYNLIIILTGLYNDLRNQTQTRLSKELTGTKEDPEGCHVVGSQYAVRWQEETVISEPGRRGTKGDFHNRSHRLPNADRPTIAVIKKNVSPLEGVIEWVSRFDEPLLRSLNVLVIDDEADHASPNNAVSSHEEENEAAQEPEIKASAIYRLLRSLLKLFPRVSYVGYTATPFANVFMAPEGDDDELGETLYPNHFIVSLPKPDGHFGIEEVFSDAPAARHPHLTIVAQTGGRNPKSHDRFGTAL